jgi:HPt (histidine-containing phosphotransfer) domain-containing protein
MTRRSLANPGQWLQIAATILCAATLTVVLIIGIRRADELQSASSALQLSAQLSSSPQIVFSELTLIQRGLETTTYVGDSLRAIATERERDDATYAQLQGDLRRAGLIDQADIATPLAAALQSWDQLRQPLTALNRRSRVELYIDTASGSELTGAGKQMKAAVDTLLAAQSTNIQTLSGALEQLGGALRSAVNDSGRSLRTLLLTGSAVAALLLGLMLYYAWRSRVAAAAAARAERQVANILGTVREGLFLVGRDLTLGETCSDSLRELLRVSAPAGQSFEELLRPLVDERTLSAALKFLGLLWRDKVHEELIESVNPLSQVEVSFPNVHGGEDTRYLAFSFRRVRSADSSGDFVLGVVADVTDRILLARELESVKADSDSQAALMLQLLSADQSQLEAFLGAADVALRKSNALLTAPGIEQEDLRKKLNGVFRELHSVKGEAAALTLTLLVQQIHQVEDTLTLLRAKPNLSGNDFLPVVVKLDELMTHLAHMQAMQQRVAAFRVQMPFGHAALEATDDHRATQVMRDPVELEPPPPAVAITRDNALNQTFRTLVSEVARAHARRVRLVTRGLEQVPPRYLGVVKDVCIQMIRNAIVHGIEPPAQRLQHGKREEGTVQIGFSAEHAEEYLLTVEDDGRGLSYEHIVDKALRNGLLQPQQAMNLDRTGMFRLIFQPGFSTADEISEYAGRGVGLDAVSNLVREHGGRIGLSTTAGQYTRFRVLLPRAVAASAHSAA